ncbi:MAG: hypothetical protein RDV48_27000 [Candidatus Eremiobacteraeota bacterium]|nr:hypothetical protein [Candidatus Eremiobacteraeota bacterium]
MMKNFSRSPMDHINSTSSSLYGAAKPATPVHAAEKEACVKDSFAGSVPEPSLPQPSCLNKASLSSGPSLAAHLKDKARKLLYTLTAYTMLTGATMAGVPGSIAAETLKEDREQGRPVLEHLETVTAPAPQEKREHRGASQEEKIGGESLEEIDFENATGLEFSHTRGGPSKDSREGSLFSMVKNADYESQVGDYRLKVGYVDYKFSLRPRVNPKLEDGELGVKARLYGQAKFDILKTELAKTEQVGEWTRTHGLRGGLQATYKLGYQGEYNTGSTNSNEVINDLDATVNLAAFGRWERSLSGSRHLTLDATAGVGHDIMENHTVPYVAFRQELTGKDGELAGIKYNWTAEAKEKIAYHIQERELDAEYEVFAGVEKTFPMKIFGHRMDTTVRVGPGVKGDIENPVAFHPRADVKVKF